MSGRRLLAALAVLALSGCDRVETIEWDAKARVVGCIDERSSDSAGRAVQVENYFDALRRLEQLAEQGVCSKPLKIDWGPTEIVVHAEQTDDLNVFRRISVERGTGWRMRESERVYINVVQLTGGGPYGWNGLEPMVLENRTMGGLLDLFSQ